nr:DUF3617 family protein [uncultured Rhodoferax sp.]
MKTSTHTTATGLLTSLALAACLATPLVQAQNLKPGQYEYTTKTEMFGMSIPISFKQCVTDQDVASNKAYVNQQGVEGCSTPVVLRKGSEITIKYNCTKPNMTGEGKGSVTEDTFTMDMRVTQHDMGGNVMKTALTAKRLGDCTK